MNEIKYYSLGNTTFKLDGGAMFGIIPRPLWNKKNSSDELNRIELSLMPLLIRNKDSLVLIDTGIGSYHSDKFKNNFSISSSANPLEDALSGIDIKCDEITDIIISHFHFDHIGGLNKLDKNQVPIPIFKNAYLHIHKEHFEYSKNPTKRDMGSFLDQYFLPMIDYYLRKEKLIFFGGESGIINKDLKFMCTHGHTPFMSHIYNDDFFYLTDIIPTSSHLKTTWVMGYDLKPGITTVEKEIIKEFIQENSLIGIFEHDPKYFGFKYEGDDIILLNKDFDNFSLLR